MRSHRHSFFCFGFLGDGTGDLSEAAAFSAGTGFSGVGDFNNDGVYDLLGSGGIALASTVSGMGPLLDFSLSTIAEARQALPLFQIKREVLVAQRAEIGANQARIEVASTVLQVAAENFQAAESRIRDADIASEAASLTRLQILQQAQTAILGQANQQPALSLALLG